MGLKGRIKALEKTTVQSNPERKGHVIIFRPGVDDPSALIEEYRRKGGKQFVCALPELRKRVTDQSNTSFKTEGK